MRVLCHYELTPELTGLLKSRCADGIELLFCPESDTENFEALLPSINVIWHVLKPITEAHIVKANALRLIQKLGVGINTIAVEAARNRKIAVCNTPNANTRAVAEMTLLHILSSLRQLPQMMQRAPRPSDWTIPAAYQNDLLELGGKTVGFVGFGAVPSLLAQWLTAMEVRVVYFSRTVKIGSPYQFLPLDALLEVSDIVSVHVPLSRETEALLDETRIMRMKAGAIIVNTARGPVVAQKALLSALKSGHLRSAGLDVFEQEPPDENDPIFSASTLTATPHVAWLTRETLMRCFDVAFENLRRLNCAEPLLYRLV